MVTASLAEAHRIMFLVGRVRWCGNGAIDDLGLVKYPSVPAAAAQC